jgi:DNA polymerase II small subunit/DNA polymerase delta subunit B
MFPKAASTSTLTGVTNPYAFTVDAVDFIGTSGQGVDDVFRYSQETDRWVIRHFPRQYSPASSLIFACLCVPLQVDAASSIVNPL